MVFSTTAGSPYPLGSTLYRTGGADSTNFALFSEQACRLELCLFDENDTETRIPVTGKTGHIWHIRVNGVGAGTRYGYRVYAQNGSANPQKLMLDPYAKTVSGRPDCSSAEKAALFSLEDTRDNARAAPKAVVTDESFDWQDDRPPQTPWEHTLIYEVHVKGFTKLRTDIPEALRGTYAGLAHPASIACLKELGVTAVELLPVNYFLHERRLQERGLRNYWGYNPLSVFALQPEYAAAQNSETVLIEFKNMVKALHRAGIEVILDIVFNHTAETERGEATFSMRGIDNDAYYWQDANGYFNFSGCGNTVNLARPAGRRWVVDCLKYWARSCRIDGFRFDLATVLGRETPGFNPEAALFSDIAAEPDLQRCKLIAEPWDIGPGGYQAGNFPAPFAEWNDRFRDDVCRFWLHKSGEKDTFARRLAGSADLFSRQGRLPHAGINFITAHDGFTLRDLTAYDRKHNEANGEHNRDGHDDHNSFNHGFEGTDNAPPETEAARFTSACCLLASLLLANGTPMLLSGDETGNTQYGNNNAYCQDNETAWLKWDKADKALLEQTRRLIGIRRQIPALNRNEWWGGNAEWFDPAGEPMSIAQWHDNHLKAFQLRLDGGWLLLFNAREEGLCFRLPEGSWHCVFHAADTRLPAEAAIGSFVVYGTAFTVLRLADSSGQHPTNLNGSEQ